MSASKAKADPMSNSQQKLSGAAKTVAKATADLVEAAKSVGIDEETPVLDFSSATATGQKTAKFEK